MERHDPHDRKESPERQEYERHDPHDRKESPERRDYCHLESYERLHSGIDLIGLRGTQIYLMQVIMSVSEHLHHQKNYK